MDNKPEFNVVTEVGTFGSLPMKDPTAIPVSEQLSKVNDPRLQAYLKEQGGQGK